MDAANHSLAKKTWQSYGTAIKHLETCQLEAGRRFTFPLKESDTILFTSWLLVRRGVRAATVDSYLSAIRQVHMIKGVTVPNLWPEIVKSVLKGGKNRDIIKDRTEGKRARLPVTINMLKLIKKKLANENMLVSSKRLIWLTCSLNFFGCFRVHETLARLEQSFDPAFTLLYKDLELKEINIEGKPEKVLQLHIKSPKEDRIGASSYVDVYETGGLLCPVRAYLKWIETGPPCDPEMPALRHKDGRPLTGRKLNEFLRKCLEDVIPYEEGFVSSHSFRSGMASLMANLGYTDSQIKAIGRWSSRAFEDYIKLPRRKRSEMAKDIGARGW